MSFLNPILLFGMTAVAVPIIIHLLNRRRFQHVVWAAMRFLQVSIQQNQRRMRLEDLLLLLVRCLLLILLALALARPAWRAGGTAAGDEKTVAVIVLDNSYSMGHTDGVQTRFERGKLAAEQAIDLLREGSSVALLLASDTAQAVIAEPTLDLALARTLLREARLTDRPSDLLPALRTAMDILKRKVAPRRELYLVTDGQRLGWELMGDIYALIEQHNDQIQTHVLLVGDGDERNLAVTGLRAASGLFPVDQLLRFEAQVTNFSDEEARDVKVTLAIGDEAPIDEGVIGLVPAGQTKGLTLFGRFRADGFHTATARIAEDRLPADDQRTIALRVLPQVRVLLVENRPPRSPQESEVFFLRHALQPVPPAEREDFFIQLRHITLAELSGVRLDEFDAVFIADVPDFSSATLVEFQQYLRHGGGLVIFPGEGTNPGFYNEQLLDRYGLIPAAFGEPRGDAGQPETHFNLQGPHYEHPIAELWNDPGAGTLTSARFYRAFPLQPAPWSASENGGQPAGNQPVPEAGEPQVVLRFADGTPAVMERSWGRGKVILFSSTVSTKWNDMAVRPSFVPLIHRTLGSILQRENEGLNLKVGGRFAYPVPAELLRREVAVSRPDLRDGLRDIRHVELVDGRPTLQYGVTDLAGGYELAIAGQPPTVLRFATQPDTRESDLREISRAELDSLGAVAHVTRWTPDVSLRHTIERQRLGTEFWLPILLLVLLLATAETFLADWFSRAK
jgi:hypothetical protein